MKKFIVIIEDFIFAGAENFPHHLPFSHGNDDICAVGLGKPVAPCCSTSKLSSLTSKQVTGWLALSASLLHNAIASDVYTVFKPDGLISCCTMLTTEPKLLLHNLAQALYLYNYRVCLLVLVSNQWKT